MVITLFFPDSLFPSPQYTLNRVSSPRDSSKFVRLTFLQTFRCCEFLFTGSSVCDPTLRRPLFLHLPYPLPFSFRYFAFLEQCEGAKACTILLRGGSKDVLNEIERNLQDAMQVRDEIYHGNIFTREKYTGPFSFLYLFILVSCRS